MSAAPQCNDCTHHHSNEWRLCRHPEAARPALGLNFTPSLAMRVQFGQEGLCGVAGKLFEATVEEAAA